MPGEARPPGEVDLRLRRKVLFVFLTQGFGGLIAVIAANVYFSAQVAEVFTLLGRPQTIALITTFFLCALAFQLLKFELTNLIFVSLGMTAYISMFPLLGIAMSSWIAVSSAIISRLLAMRQIGPVKIDMRDRPLEYAKTFGLFGTYGIPVVAACLVYDALGGETPLLIPSFYAVTFTVISAFAMILANQLVMIRPMRVYGYSARQMVRLIYLDSSLYSLTMPYAVCMTLSYGAIGLGAVLALAFSGILAYTVTRNLAVTQSESRQQLQRLASLSHIGKTISLKFTTEQLLMTIYTECSKVIDASLFSIALLDEQLNELVFELDVRDGIVQPKVRLPIGGGLNSWVVEHHQPLLLGSVRDEEKMGIVSVQDGMTTESWVGVPMTARDRVIGVISVQSYKKNAFSQDDILLLTSIANQAAVALENANLYRDLEGLTLALEQRVLDRTNELREANLRLLAADRSKNQFLANMSHELRTPLNSIIGFSTVLLESTKEMISARQYKFLDNIRAAGNHLLELINDILDLSKIEAGKMELRTDSFDVRETVASVERVMRGQVTDPRVRITSRIADDVPPVRLDEGRLKQILYNLLSNAVKFSPDGGPVEVKVSKVDGADSPIGIESIRIDVSDRGIGIPEDEIKRIFDEFYQTEEGRRTRRGTGLGLSLARNFVELHRGIIEVRSEPGKGSTFTMFLPVDYQIAAARLPVSRGVRPPAALHG